MGISGNQCRRQLDDILPQRDEDTVARLCGKNRAAGEAAEGWQDERVVPKKETRQSQRSAFAIGNLHHRMPVAGNVQAIPRRVGGIVKNPDGFTHIEMRYGVESGGDSLELGVVISRDEGDGDRNGC